MPRKLPYPAAVALLAAVYFAAAKLGLLAAVAQAVVSSAWPPAGLALAALLLFGTRYWPAITIGAFLLNASSGVQLAGAVGIAVGNTLEAVVGTLLLQRVGRFRPSLERLQDVLALVLLAAAVSTVVSATIGVASLWWSGAISSASYGSLWFVWWLGDAMGVLVFAPLFLTWAATPRLRESPGRAVEALAIVALLVVLTDALFGLPFNYVYAIFPVVSWAALRFGPRGAATATTLVTGLAVWSTLHGRGPFVASTPTENLALLQTFVGLLAVTALVLAALVTERTTAEQAVRESETHYRVLFESNPNPLLVYDLDTLGLLAVNEAAVQQYGYTREEFLGMTLEEIHLPQDVPALRELVAKSETGLRKRGEWRHRRKDGTIIEAEITRNTLTFAGRRAALALAQDITGRRGAAEALRAAQARFAGILDIADDAIISVDAHQHIHLFNKGAERIFGYAAEEVLGQSLDVLLPARVVNVHREHIRGFAQSTESARRMGERAQIFGRRKDGTEFPAEASISKLQSGGETVFTVILRDTTERQSLQAQLLQAQKMEAVGRLAGGIAHDFNNLLTAILGASDLLLEDLSADASGREEVEEIKQAAHRAAALTYQLLAFSRQQVLAPQVLDLNVLVADVEKMLRRLIGEDIELRTVLARDLGAVQADPGQLQQVIMNLAVNARDAMPQGGRLTIETADAELDEAYAQAHVPQAGRYVMLAVTDTGIGMNADIKAHVFEPFFTTKEKGKGTGLGLATVYGIVKQSGGYIWVYSEPGQGTTFKIYLPRVEGVPLPAAPKPVASGSLRGSETVLVVEDEVAVRNLTRRVLEGYGYAVLTTENGHEALQAAQERQGPIHLLVTDVVMPKMGGRELVQRLAPGRPEMKVLYLSGYTDDAIVHHGVLEPGIAFLQKPFTPQMLARKVREVLDGA
jgi:two-component system, cell cycle sensor histidine kinase and response regulator CckA